MRTKKKKKFNFFYSYNTVSRVHVKQITPHKLLQLVGKGITGTRTSNKDFWLFVAREYEKEPHVKTNFFFTFKLKQ